MRSEMSARNPTGHAQPQNILPNMAAAASIPAAMSRSAGSHAPLWKRDEARARSGSAARKSPGVVAGYSRMRNDPTKAARNAA
jgi:hypothetical protein